MLKKQAISKKINRLIALFPMQISVKVEPSEDSGFFAEVKTFPGCITQADTFLDLVDMVNDAVRTYLEIPESFLPYMPTYIPPVSVAQEFGILPLFKTETEIKLGLASPCETAVPR